MLPRFQGSHGMQPLHLVLPVLGRSVRPMLDRALHLYHRYYSPRQQLSLDEWHDSHQEPFTIKQYIRDKLVRWGKKSFLLCEAKRGYILNAEVYTGWVKDCHWHLLASARSVVSRFVENSQVANKNHMLFMDRFYNSVMLFHLLENELAVDTFMPSTLCAKYLKKHLATVYENIPLFDFYGAK